MQDAKMLEYTAGRKIAGREKMQDMKLIYLKMQDIASPSKA